MLSSVFKYLALFAHAGSLQMQSLEDASIRKVTDILEGKPAVAMVFQPNCHSCKEQVRDLKCLGVPVFLVGAFHHRKRLQTEYLKMKTQFPAYEANSQVFKTWSVKKEITPQILLFDKAGRVKSKVIGSRSCAKLKKKLNL